MIDLIEIVELIEKHTARTGETMTELSRRATGSTETIRNWKRRLDRGENPSAKFDNVQAVLAAIGVELSISNQVSKIRSNSEILTTLQRVEGLSPTDVTSFLTMITNTIKANTASRERTAPDDQSEHDIRHHESEPSR